MSVSRGAAECTARVIGWQLKHNTGPALIVLSAMLLTVFLLARMFLRAREHKHPRKTSTPPWWAKADTHELLVLLTAVAGIVEFLLEHWK